MEPNNIQRQDENLEAGETKNDQGLAGNQANPRVKPMPLSKRPNFLITPEEV